MIESVHIDSRLLAVIRESWTILREKTPDEIHVGVIVQADSEHGQPLRRVLLRQFHQQRIFVAARFAPRRPESYEKRLAVIFSERLVVAGEIDQGQICGRRCGRSLSLWFGCTALRGSQTGDYNPGN